MLIYDERKMLLISKQSYPFFTPKYSLHKISVIKRFNQIFTKNLIYLFLLNHRPNQQQQQQ